jgi:stearoyl-CoA desaturase (delta-9 desaturase)
VGWILCDKYGVVDYEDKIADFNRYPELRFLDKWNIVPAVVLAVGCYLYGGWAGLIVGFFWSTVILWHATFTVNSLAHVVGTRRYATSDTSRNSVLIALYTGGEGWHNNHHYRPSSARQGFYWWEIDTSYYILRGLNLVGLVRDINRPTKKHRLTSRIKDGAFDIGMFRAYWTKASGKIATVRADAGERLGALDDAVHNALESAEELAKATRRTRKAAGFAD